MRMWQIIFFAAIVVMTQAVTAEPDAVIWTKSNPKKVQALFPDGSVRMLDGNTRRELDSEDGFMPPIERNAMFKRLKLDSKLKKMDELEKDLLVVRARQLDISLLIKAYPNLGKSNLQKLKKELGVEIK